MVYNFLGYLRAGIEEFGVFFSYFDWLICVGGATIYDSVWALKDDLLIPDYSSLLKVDLSAYRDFHSLIKHLEKLVPAHAFKIM